MTVRTLVTGGAGFIGSHLVRALRRCAATRSSCSTASSSRSTGTAAPDLPDGVELIVGNVGDAERRRSSARGRRPGRPPRGARSASGSRCTRSLATPSSTRWRRRASSSARRSAPAADAARRRVLDVDLRRGRVRVRRARPRGARSRAPRSSCWHAQWELPAARSAAASSRPVAHDARPSRSSRRPIYAVTKRDHEELCLVTGAAYGIPTVALRFFNVYGPGQALSNPYTGVAAIFASRLLNEQAAGHLRGRRAIARLHPCVATSSQGILLALESDGAVGHALNLGTGRPTHASPQVAAVLSAGIGRRHRAGAERPVPRRRHPALLRRCRARARAARLPAAGRLRGWHGASCSTGSQDQAGRRPRGRRDERARRPRARR